VKSFYLSIGADPGFRKAGRGRRRRSTAKLHWGSKAGLLLGNWKLGVAENEFLDRVPKKMNSFAYLTVNVSSNFQHTFIFPQIKGVATARSTPPPPSIRHCLSVAEGHYFKILSVTAVKICLILCLLFLCDVGLVW